VSDGLLFDLPVEREAEAGVERSELGQVEEGLTLLRDYEGRER
jgi:hypothetical protein